MTKWILGILGVVVLSLVLMMSTKISESMITTTTELFGEDVTAWVRMDSNDNVKQLGVDIPLSVIENAPEGEMPPTIVRLKFPEKVHEVSFFNHIDIDYNPGGHPPGPYLVPHFDIHFYGITEESQLSIDCTDSIELGDGELPEHHILTAPGPPPEGECVPEMGHHGIDVRSPELHPEAPQPFTKTMILGYYAGEMIFVEPMITKAFFMERNSFTLPVILPEVLPRETQYPTEFYAEYDAEHDVYRLIFSEFEMR